MNALTTNWAVVTAALKEERAREARAAARRRHRLPSRRAGSHRAPGLADRATDGQGAARRRRAPRLVAGVRKYRHRRLGERPDRARRAQCSSSSRRRPGVVRRILVHDGDHVAKGQALVLLDPTRLGRRSGAGEQGV